MKVAENNFLEILVYSISNTSRKDKLEMKKFNEVVIEKMKKLNITRYRLHKLTGISQSTLLRIERNHDGTFEFSNVLKIAKALDIDLNIFKED